MNSVLNPEAPEFHPLLTNAVQDGFMRVTKTIKTSNSFPIGYARDVYMSYPDFVRIKCQITDNVVTQSNQIVAVELPDAKLKRSYDDVSKTDKIIDVNDSFLDRININIDTIRGIFKPNEQFLKGMNPAMVASWNSAPVIAKIKVGDATFIGAKNIPRPQLTFKDPVDNSYALWVPKISDKPNNIKPLALNILYNMDGEAVGYEHPYSVELDLYHPPAHFIEPDPVLPDFPPPLNGTPLTMVNTEAKLDELVQHLRGCDEIAVDVEHHSYRSYQGITCLIQITTYEGGDFLIDTLAIREHVHKLNDSFTDPKKVKILHGADHDVKWLQRDFGIYIVGLFDTFQAGKLLQLPSLSLKNLLARYCQVETDKKYQMADWRIRPLPQELIDYARTDTHYLLYIWRTMKSHLLERGNGLPTLLLSAFENSRQTSCLTYNKEVMDETCHLELYTRSKKSFNTQQLSAFKILYKWRDAEARQLDEGPSYLIPNHMLLNLAETLPRDIQGVNACCTPMPPFVKINILPIHRMILSCREMPMEPVVYEMPTSIRNMAEVHHLNNYNVHDLTYLPECREDQINLDLPLQFVDNTVVEINNVRLDVQPDLQVMAPEQANLSAGVVSTLNVDAEMFIPPYDRYRAYRSISHATEIKEFKEKEAKVAALVHGNELIKTEVLTKLQAQRDAAEANAKLIAQTAPKPQEIKTEQQEPTDTKTVEEPTVTKVVQGSIDEEKAAKNASQRKRKIEKAAAIQPADDKKKEPQKTLNEEPKVKSFEYMNVNYKKFYSGSEKGRKQPKMKFKKS